MTDASIPTHITKNPAVLEPAFLDGLDGLSTDELRRRRDEVLAEREFQSYLRRILQVRLDLLKAEQDRRRAGAEPGHIVDRLTKVLAEGPPRTSRGEAVRFSLSADEMEDADRRVEVLLGGVAETPSQDLGDDELAQTLEALRLQERAVSTARLAVFSVHDALQDELKRRYREDPSAVQRPL
jgi:hypothetical protein